MKFDRDSSDFELNPYVLGIRTDFPYFKGVFYYKNKKISYGTAFTSSKLLKDFVLEGKCGKMGLGGTVSSIKNPFLSSQVSPFSEARFSAKSMSAGLPSSSGFDKPFSIFTSCRIQNKSVFSDSGFQSYYSFDGSGGAEFVLKVKLPEKWVLGVTGTVGTFILEKPSEDSWFLEKPLYRTERIFSQVLQAEIKNVDFSFVFRENLFKSPFGKIYAVHQAEAGYKAKTFSVGIQGVYNPDDGLITSAGKFYSPVIQIKGNIQNKKRIDVKIPLFIKTGFSVFYDGKLSEAEDLVKASGAFSFLCFLTGLNASLTGEFGIPVQKIKMEEFSLNIKKISGSIKNTWYFEKIQPAVKAVGSCVFSEKDGKRTYTEDTVIYLNFGYNPLVSLTAGISFEWKDKVKQNTDFDFGVNMKITSKHFNCLGKISFRID